MTKQVSTVGITAARHKPEALERARQFCSAVVAAGRNVLVETDLLELIGDCAGSDVQPVSRHDLGTADLVVALGGDGTLLSVARAAAERGTPLVGVDLGSFGFLAAEPYETVESLLGELLEGRFAVEERMMVAAEVNRPGGAISTHYGLNEAVIARADPRRLVRLRIWIDEEEVGLVPADGIVISTPTGSTAYALSAGGPILMPTVEALVVAPICPHTLYSRPLVVPPSSVIQVGLGDGRAPAAGVTLTLDGQEAVDLGPQDLVRVHRAPFTARLVRLSPAGPYQRLRTKLRWGV